MRTPGLRRVPRAKKNPATTIVVSVLAVLLLGLTLLYSFAYYSEDSHTECVVSGKDRTTSVDSDGNSSSDARVYTKNCGVFQVSDTIIKRKFNSSDTFGSLEEGGIYNFTTIGFRVGFFSMFPNIIEAEEQ